MALWEYSNNVNDFDVVTLSTLNFLSNSFYIVGLQETRFTKSKSFNRAIHFWLATSRLNYCLCLKTIWMSSPVWQVSDHLSRLLVPFAIFTMLQAVLPALPRSFCFICWLVVYLTHSSLHSRGVCSGSIGSSTRAFFVSSPSLRG